MKLINLFKKKNTNYNINNTRFDDNTVIPGREYFKDSTKIKIIEEYKKYYIKELSERDTVTVSNFNSESLKENMNINLDLIIKILKENGDFSLLPPEELIIQSLKLKIYSKEINKLEEEIIARIIALKEIEKSKIVSIHNRKTLSEEINQLSEILDRKVAIKIELEKYTNMINNKNLTNENEDFYKQRLERLLYVTDSIIDSSKINKYDDIRLQIAILECKCEKFTNKNKNKIKYYKEQLKNLENISFNIINDNYMLNKYREIEKHYLLFHYFSSNIIDEEDLYNLSSLKFRYLTNSLTNMPDSKFLKDDILFDYFKNIISVKIEKIISGNNENFNYNFSLDKRRAIEFISNYLKSNNEYNYEDILLDKKKLCLILSFDEKYGYEMMLKNIIIDKDQYEYRDIIFNQKGITWEKYISLHSIYEVTDFYATFRAAYFINDFYKLFDIYYKSKLHNSDEYYLPEGIKKFNSTLFSSNYYEFLRCRMIDKTVHLPSTLKVITGPLLGESTVKNVIINNGLEKILGNKPVFNTNSTKRIVIPSTLLRIDENSIDKSKIKEIIFTDYEDSNILNTDYKLINFMNGLLKKEAIRTTKHNAPYQITRVQYSMITPLFDKIILISKDGERFELSQIGLSFKFKDGDFTSLVHDSEIKLFIQKLWKTLEEKKKYSLEEEEEKKYILTPKKNNNRK